MISRLFACVLVVTSVPPQEQRVSSGEDLVGLRGKDLQLYCIFSSFPVKEPSWQKDGSSMRLEGRVSTENFGKSLLISNVTEDDAGTYKCDFDISPQLNRDFDVQIEAAPYWPTGRGPASQNSSEGETVQFDCKSNGIPDPTYTFYKNGEELEAGDGVSIDGSVLTIYDLQKTRRDSEGNVVQEGDNAVYQCRVENEHGYIWANFYLNVLAFKPIILMGPGNPKAMVDQVKTLECKVFGSPLPQVEWRGSAVQGSIVSDPQPVDRDGISRITIKGVTDSSKGEIICSATNKYGHAEKSGYLTVMQPTRITVMPPKEQTLTAGQELRLPCEATHDPSLDISVQWLVDGVPVPQELLDSKHYRLEFDNTLVITQAGRYDTATYTCRATTDLDSTDFESKLIIEDVPYPPHSSYVRKCANRSAVIRFSYNEPLSVAAPATEFWVQYLIDPETEPHSWHTHNAPVVPTDEQTKIDGKLRSFTVPVTVALSPYGQYQFRVIARNRVGDSSPDVATGECETPSALPDRNPTGVRADGSTPDNLIVYWDPMPREEWNGGGFKYVVKYRPEDAEEGDEWVEEEVADPYQDHLVVEDQPMYEPYEVQVKAANDLGESPVEPKTVHGFSGEGVPSEAPGNFQLVSKTATSATFSWDPVDPASANGEMKGYKVVHWHEEDGRRRRRSASEKKEAYFDEKADRGIVYGLKPNKLNKAYVVSYNGAHDGPPSDTLEIQTPEGVATPVRRLTCYPLSHQEIGVVWRTPRELNGNLKNYWIEWNKLLEVDGVEVKQEREKVELFLPADSNHIRVPKLEPNQKYRFEVAAETGGGKGDPNSVDCKTTSMTTPIGAPAEPGLEKAGIGEDHINVTWIPGVWDEEKPKPIGDRHYIKYRAKGSSNWETMEPVNGNFTVRLVGLDQGTTYEVRAVSVSGTDEEEEETESASHFYTTGGEAPGSATAAWLIAIIVAIIILIIILIIVCLVVRNRGAKYPVSEKEREQGREPMLGKEEKGFGEYARPDVEDEKRSLTGESKPESETDSMAEYGDAENAGRFTEDGSFIGQYGASKVLYAPSADRSNVSTFV